MSTAPGYQGGRVIQAAQGWLRRIRRGLYTAVPINAERPHRVERPTPSLSPPQCGPVRFTGGRPQKHWGLTQQVFQTIVVQAAARVNDHGELRGYQTDRESGGTVLWQPPDFLATMRAVGGAGVAASRRHLTVTES